MSRMNILSNVHIAKRHSVGAVLIGILCLFSILIPGVLWIFTMFPYAKVYINAVPEGSNFTAGAATITILDLIKTMINQKVASTQFVITNGWQSSQYTGNILYYYLIRENVIAIAGWYALSALMAVILFILGFVLLIRGKLSRKGAPVVVAFWAMVANGMMIADGFRLGWYLNRAMSKAMASQGMEGFSGVKINIWPNYITGIAAGSVFILMFFIWLIALRNRYYLEDIEFVDIESEKRPFERNDGVLRNTIPLLTSVGGHAFAKNCSLEIANIAEGVSELGVGAFSNCLRLKTVSIPLSVKNIEANCFFNCIKLRRINYAGTKMQWREIKRGSNWLSRAGTSTVVCSDGAISVDPYK